jgi:hypothetical protein
MKHCLLLAILFISPSNLSQVSDDSPISLPTLTQVLKFGFDQSFKQLPLPQIVNKDTVLNFDLSKMTALASQNRKHRESRFWVLGRDSTNKIVEISHVEKQPKFGNFSLKIFHAQGFSIWLMSSYYFKPELEQGFEHLNGYFFRLDQSNQIYHVSTPQNPALDIDTGGNFPLIDAHNLFLSECDSNLEFKRVYCIKNKELVSFIEINHPPKSSKRYEVYHIQNVMKASIKKDIQEDFLQLRQTCDSLKVVVTAKYQKSTLNSYAINLPLWVNVLQGEKLF